MAKNKNSVLITGGAGFIGSTLAEKLLRQGKGGFVIDDLSTGNKGNIKALKAYRNFHFTKGTVLEKKKMENLVKKSGLIYHLAASVGVKTIMEKPLESFLNNMRGTETILYLATKYKLPILLTSSSEVYGKNDGSSFREDSDRVYGSAYNDRWGYALSKGSDEFLALAYFREKKLPVVIVRLFNVIGPKQSALYGMVVPRFIKQAASGQPITVYGDGRQTRCFSDVEDVVDALVGLMSTSKAVGQIFNLGSDREITVKELAQMVKEITKSRSKITFIPYTRAYGSGFEDMAHRKPDLTKIKKILGYEPKVSLEESLKRIIAYLHASR